MASASPTDSPVHASSPKTYPGAVEIDASARFPVLFFVGSSLIWLLLGSVLALINSFQLHSPGFFADCPWLTFGRVHPAQVASLLYGAGVNGAFAISFWIMARLAKAILPQSALLAVAGVFWNIGVTLGVIGILIGDSTGLEWLEIPGYASPLMVISFAVIAAWGIITFSRGVSSHVYISQWYIFAALFWFPWLYSGAQIMGIFAPARGTVQSLVDAWFIHGLVGLWFLPIGLAAAYYFLPKLLGKPIKSYYLAPLGFLALAIFSGWTAGKSLIGGPVPAWVQTVGTAASLFLLVTVFVISVNLLGSLVGNFRELKSSPALRFIAFGALNFTIVGVIAAITSLHGVAEVVGLTQFGAAQAQEALYGFFGLVAFGALYFIVPRLLLREWPSALLISVHFWTCALGLVLIVLALAQGGFVQGLLVNAPTLAHRYGFQSTDDPIEFVQIAEKLAPYFLLRTVGGVLLLIGHLAFAVNFFWMLLIPPDRVTTPTELLQPAPDMEATAP